MVGRPDVRHDLDALAGRRRAGLHAVRHGGPLGLRRRLHLGERLRLGLGAVPLRPLGVHRRPRLVVDPRARVPRRLGRRGGGRRLLEYVGWYPLAPPVLLVRRRGGGLRLRHRAAVDVLPARGDLLAGARRARRRGAERERCRGAGTPRRRRGRGLGRGPEPSRLGFAASQVPHASGASAAGVAEGAGAVLAALDGHGAQEAHAATHASSMSSRRPPSGAGRSRARERTPPSRRRSRAPARESRRSARRPRTSAGASAAAASTAEASTVVAAAAATAAAATASQDGRGRLGGFQRQDTTPKRGSPKRRSWWVVACTATSTAIPAPNSPSVATLSSAWRPGVLSSPGSVSRAGP